MYACQLFSVKCMRFFVSTESEFLKIYRHLPLITEGFQQLPKISQRLPMITEGLERFSMTSKQGVQRFSKDFQAISSIIKEFRRCSDNFSNVKNYWIFIHSVFKQLHSLLSVRREKLVWMREITILDPQAWDSHIMHESGQVYGCKLNLHRDLRWVAKRTRKFPRKYTQVTKKKTF